MFGACRKLTGTCNEKTCRRPACPSHAQTAAPHGRQVRHLPAHVFSSCDSSNLAFWIKENTFLVIFSAAKEAADASLSAMAWPGSCRGESCRVRSGVSPEGKCVACKLLKVFLCFVRRYKPLARRAGLCCGCCLRMGGAFGLRVTSLQCSLPPREGAAGQAALARRPAAPPGGCN